MFNRPLAGAVDAGEPSAEDMMTPPDEDGPASLYCFGNRSLQILCKKRGIKTKRNKQKGKKGYVVELYLPTNQTLHGHSSQILQMSMKRGKKWRVQNVVREILLPYLEKIKIF